jgi:hypothetical protein
MTDPKKSPAAELKAMKLAKNYRPAGDFLIEETDEAGTVTIREANENEGTGESLKVKAGTVIHVPLEEARRMNKLGIAVRNDDF